jgi:hypothetical protein
MKTTKILFTAPATLKAKAQARAQIFDITLTDVLNEALELFVSGGVDTDPLSKAEKGAIRRSEKQIKEGKLVSLEHVMKELNIR